MGWLLDTVPVNERLTRGRVKFWKPEKGWGAICSEVLPAGRDAFAHFAVIEAEGYRELSEGQLVDFTYHAARQESFEFVADWVRVVPDEWSADDLRLRPAATVDAEWLRKLHDAAYAVLCDHFYDERANAWQSGFFAARIAHPMNVFVIDRGGTDIGAIYLEDRPSELHVESLEVLPEHQGRGVGSTALRWVLNRAGQDGRTVSLQVHRDNSRARRLYERLGLSVLGETATHYRMQL